MQLPSEVEAQAQHTETCSRIHSWLAAINASKSPQSPGIKQRGVGNSYKNIPGKKCGWPLEEIDTNMASPTKRRRGRGGNALSGVRDAIGEKEEKEDNSKTPTKLPSIRSTRQHSQGQDSSAGGFTSAKLNTVGPSSTAGLPDRPIMMVDPPPSMPLPLSTALQAGSESGASSFISNSISSTSSVRSTSPIKKKLDLKLCTHQVKYTAEPPRRKELPQDIQTLWADLHKIALTTIGVLPKELRDITAFNNDNEDNELGLEGFHFSSSNNKADMNSIIYEYLAVKQLLKHTRACKAKEKHEPAWNEEVHWPALNLALGAHFEDKLAVENVTRATIDTAFTPTFFNASGFSTSALQTAYVQSKMVDYSIHWIPTPNSSTANAIDRFISTLRPGTNQPEKTINQSTYTAIRDRPAAIAVETKAFVSAGGGGGRDPYVQLGIWNIAWLKRVRSILALDINNARTEHRIITLPMIYVDASDWKLSFLCDSSTAITSVSPTVCTNEASQTIRDNKGSSILFDFPYTIGSTNTILDCYKLIMSLRRIGEWVTQVYGPWWEAVVRKAIVGRFEDGEMG